MGGFAASLTATFAARDVQDGDPAAALGYYDGGDLPVYDHLAEEFAVCDRWCSSVPGATWPNRLYSLCGSAAGSRDDLPPHVPPFYYQPSLARHLDAHHVPWRWYSFDPATLRMADAHYLLGHHDRFAYFSKTGLPWGTRLDVSVNAKIGSFLEDAAAGALRSVSWIDPAFTSFNPLGFPSTMTTHPPMSGTARTWCPGDRLGDAAARASAQTRTDGDGTDREGPGDHQPTDLQRRILAATHELTRRGHPRNAP
jgi:phospholipase C